MKRETAITLCSLVLISGFFLPIFEWHSFEMSGLNYVLSRHFDSFKYILLLIPFSAIILFLGAFYRKQYIFSNQTLVWTPLLSLVAVSVFHFRSMAGHIRFFGNDSLFSGMSMGFWILLGFSILIIFINGRARLSMVR